MLHSNLEIIELNTKNKTKRSAKRECSDSVLVFNCLQEKNLTIKVKTKKTKNIRTVMIKMVDYNGRINHRKLIKTPRLIGYLLSSLLFNSTLDVKGIASATAGKHVVKLVI